MEIFSAAGNVTEVVSLPTPKKSWYGGRVRKGQTLFVVQAKVVDVGRTSVMLPIGAPNQ